MSEGVKITSLKLENVKRVRAVQLEPSENGLTIIGGKNRQGKTSVLDAIAWALGGEKYKPSNPKFEESVLPPDLEVRLSNGLLVTRKGKNSTLTVTDTQGTRQGQRLLDEFVSTFAIDLPKFMGSTSKEKAETLLKIVGVEDELKRLEQQEQDLYSKRRYVGQDADKHAKYAEGLPHYNNVPDAVMSVAELAERQQEIIRENRANQQKRDELARAEQSLADAQKQKAELQRQLEEMTAQAMEMANKVTALRFETEQLVDKDTKDIEESIAHIDTLNQQIRANADKQNAANEAAVLKAQYDSLTQGIESARQAKKDLLKHAHLPLEGLNVEDGELTYFGQKWDCMSGAEQLIVSTAIAKEVKPSCGFVLLDRLEQMDTDTLKDFGKWLEKNQLQAIATRVSTGEECTIIIEDGAEAKPDNHLTTADNAESVRTVVSEPQAPQKRVWKEGEF